MKSAADSSRRPQGATRPAPLLEVRCAARDTAVRRALAEVLAALALRPGLPEERLPEERRQTLELVLAELLNNVVEHACASDRPGAIVIRGRRAGSALCFEVSDDGGPMPGGALPSGMLPDLDTPCADLPEGGFGWCLIRSLTEDLRYCRSAGRNHVSFRLPLTPRSEPPARMPRKRRIDSADRPEWRVTRKG
ncbi:MAG: ATP-binding protein [Paracoccaceae bacterium]